MKHNNFIFKPTLFSIVEENMTWGQNLYNLTISSYHVFFSCVCGLSACMLCERRACERVRVFVHTPGCVRA